MVPLRISLARYVKLIRYPTMIGELISRPLCISLTDFHVIVAYTDRVKAINLLDDQPVFSENTCNALGSTLIGGACRDPASGSIFLYSGTKICQLIIDHEDLRVWKIYLERGEFNKARKHCKVWTCFQISQQICLKIIRFSHS